MYILNVQLKFNESNNIELRNIYKPPKRIETKMRLIDNTVTIDATISSLWKYLFIHFKPS